MNKNLLTFILTLLICASASAQTDIDIKNQYKITGQIVEVSSEKAVPYTTIRVLNVRNETVTVEASDILGYFSLKVKSPGSYLIKFDAMGYGADSLTVNITESVTNIGVIKLPEGQQLTGVTVSAKKLIMKQEVDKLVYDVTNDPEAKRLKMADIMKKIPFMTINALDGKLKYLDNTISTILINGKSNEMISGGRQFPMRLIKGDVMSSIEIIMPGTKDNPGDKPILVYCRRIRNFSAINHYRHIDFKGRRLWNYQKNMGRAPKVPENYKKRYFMVFRWTNPGWNIQRTNNERHGVIDWKIRSLSGIHVV